MSSNILWSIGVAFLSYVGYRLFRRILGKIAQRKGVDYQRLFYIQKVFEILFVVTALVIIAFVWSVDIKGVSVFASSVFAIIGVAMFAQWSILSNVTASIIIFFTFPARIGDKIRVVDGDNSVEGTIQEISLFQIELKDSDNHTILYPNNLLLQRPVIKL
ncbi:MAG: mechanosensitive ion channel [Helicobacteraceae bacterium]|jgi:small-conductance mechanosensitive channel|nr:mechanosensitive ion channel [Helicobacteraceae bacterium]